MKRQQVPAPVAVTIIVLVVGAIFYFMMQKSGGFDREYKNLADMPMPKAAAEGMAKMQKELQAKKAKGGD